MKTLATPATDTPDRTTDYVRYSHNGQTIKKDWQRKMIEEHLPLVRHVVERLRLYTPTHFDNEDLLSIGLLGLISAVLRFDPQKKESFPAYAKVRIRGAIIDELRRQGWRTRRVATKARQIEETHSRLEQSLRRAPTVQEMAEALQISPSEYERWIDETKACYFISLNQPVGEQGEGGTVEDSLTDEHAEMPYTRLEKKDLTELLLKKVRTLPDIQAKVMTMCYVEEMRLSEIAASFGLTESRISQIHAQAIMTLRAAVRRELRR